MAMRVYSQDLLERFFEEDDAADNEPSTPAGVGTRASPHVSPTARSVGPTPRSTGGRKVLGGEGRVGRSPRPGGTRSKRPSVSVTVSPRAGGAPGGTPGQYAGPGGAGAAAAASSAKIQTVAANEERYREMHEKARREAERRIQENAKRREAQFNEMFARVQNGIDRKSGILKDVDQIVEQSDRSKDKRARELYASWNEQVYNNIQRQIETQLNERSTKQIEDRLNAKYNAFLAASNQKSGVLGASIPLPSTKPGDPDREVTFAGGLTAGSAGGAPFGAGGSAGAGAIKVHTRHLSDPLKRSLLKIKEERSSFASRPFTGTLHTAGAGGKKEAGDKDGAYDKKTRTTLDPSLWSAKGIKTTPFGRVVTGTYQSRTQSDVFMNHFSFPEGNGVAFETFPKGKRTFDSHSPLRAGAGKARKDGRPPFFSLMQMEDKDRVHSELIRSGDTHGDQWLLSRGKLMGAFGPMRQGEMPRDPDQQRRLSMPSHGLDKNKWGGSKVWPAALALHKARDGAAGLSSKRQGEIARGGQAQMEYEAPKSRGKGVNKNMFDLVAHTHVPGVTGGDMWLEAKGKQKRNH